MKQWMTSFSTFRSTPATPLSAVTADVGDDDGGSGGGVIDDEEEADVKNKNEPLRGGWGNIEDKGSNEPPPPLHEMGNRFLKPDHHYQGHRHRSKSEDVRHQQKNINQPYRNLTDSPPCSSTSSGDEVEWYMLEKAIKRNDAVKVKQFLNVHRDRFQIVGNVTEQRGKKIQKEKKKLEKNYKFPTTKDSKYFPRHCGRSYTSLSSSSSTESDTTAESWPDAHEASIFKNALHLAVEYGSIDVVRLLMKGGVDANSIGCAEPDENASPEKPPTPGTSKISSPPCKKKDWLEEGTSRKVSWIRTATGNAAEEAGKKTLTRQRSLSYERVASGEDLDRNCASLKSSPRGRKGDAKSGAISALIRGEGSVEQRSIMAELRRSSEIFKSILLNLSMSVRDTTDATLLDMIRSSSISSAIDGSNNVDLDLLLCDHQGHCFENVQEDSASSDSSSEFVSNSSDDEAEESAVLEESDMANAVGVERRRSDGRWAEVEQGSHLKANFGNDAAVKIASMCGKDRRSGKFHHRTLYTRLRLYRLPPLFLAVVRGNRTVVAALLKYGANVHFKDELGNTALHLCVCQSSIPWGCVVHLVENGAKICDSNALGVKSVDATSSLANLQAKIVRNCWTALTVSQTSGANVQTNFATSAKAIATPVRILRKLRSNPNNESVTDDRDGATTTAVLTSGSDDVVLANSDNSPAPVGTVSSGSGGNNVNNKSLENKDGKPRADPSSSTSGNLKSKRKQWRDAVRDGHVSTQSVPVASFSGAFLPSSVTGNSSKRRHLLQQRKAQQKQSLQHQQHQRREDFAVERCLKILVIMAGNGECLGLILRGLNANIHTIMSVFQQKNDKLLRQALAALMHVLLRTTLKEYAFTGEDDNRVEIVAAFCLLLKVSLQLIHGVHGLQYTAMLTINKIIDYAILHKLSRVKVSPGDHLAHPYRKTSPLAASFYHRRVEPSNSNKENEEIPITSAFRYFLRKGSQSSQMVECADKCAQSGPPITQKGNQKGEDLSVAGILNSPHGASVLNTVHNALTLYKRVINSRRTCTPSKRQRACSYHCLQLLSARALLFMAQNVEVQEELAQEQQLRFLAATLDMTNDAQLLISVLQIMAIMAQNPNCHKIFIEQGIPDMLSQLTLPSDQWYYVNHSISYSRFVRYHVSRLLVYLGFQHRVISRFVTYDVLTEEIYLPEGVGAQIGTGITNGGVNGKGEKDKLESKEESGYINATSIYPSVVSNYASSGESLVGISLEFALFHVLATIESTLCQASAPFETCTMHWVVNGYSYGQIAGGNNASNFSSSFKLPVHVDSMVFAQHFMSCFPCIVNPIVLIRLLGHRLMATAYLRRGKSSASRSSISSMLGPHEGPKTPRSRASSAETECSTLRKRRKVNLTLDCSPGWEEVEDAKQSSGKPQHKHRGDSIGSSSGLGIEPAMQAIYAVSHFLKYAQSRDSIRSTASYDVDRSFLDSPTNMTFHPFGGAGLNNGPLSHHRKSRLPFRFSSLKQSYYKQQLKSQQGSGKMDQSTQPPRNRRETIEQDILAFQKQLQNLPDFDSPDSSINNIMDAAMAVEFLAGRTNLKPRSRSLPRVTYESSRYLTLPDVGLPIRLPRGRSAGTLGFQDFLGCGPTLFSPATTPTEERRLSGVPFHGANTGGGGGGASGWAGIGSCATNSRRSSLSPAASERAANRRRDSPAFQMETVPLRHRAVFSFVEEWLRISRVDLECNPPLHRELRDFLAKVGAFGSAYAQWCSEMKMEFPLLGKDPDIDRVDDLDEINKQYCQLSKLVVSGELHCSKEEAATLAGIQLRVEETWGRPEDTTTTVAGAAAAVTVDRTYEEDCLGGAGSNSGTLKPISEDKECFLIEVPTLGGCQGEARANSRPSALSPDLIEEEAPPPPLPPATTATTATVVSESLKSTPRKVVVPTSQAATQWPLLKKCYKGEEDGNIITDPQPFMPSAVNFQECLPPCYKTTKTMLKMIKEEKRKLFHTWAYESEVQLKKLYVQTCRRLPSYNCKIFLVKELVGNKTGKKGARLLGIGPERICLLDCKTKILSKAHRTVDLQQWRSGGGRSHDRLTLEFRSGARWCLVAASAAVMRDIGIALWQTLQHVDADFLNQYANSFPAKLNSQASNAAADYSKSFSSSSSSSSSGGKNVGGSSSSSSSGGGLGLAFEPIYSTELESFQKLLHFPEEVALSLCQGENHLFYQVPPIDYLRQATLDLSGNDPCCSGNAVGTSVQERTSVRTLVKRFNEVSCWITHLIVMQPTHEDRKCVLSCILRMAVTCWNIGNFNAAMEIFAGLKSIKLKPFWLSIVEKECEGVPTLDWLANALLTSRYDQALNAALHIPHCPVVPFFATFLKQLTDIVSHCPSLVVLAPNLLPQRDKEWPDTEDEDDYSTIVNAAGIVNLDKMYQAQNILNKVATFHQHFYSRQRYAMEIIHIDSECKPDNIHWSSIERSYLIDEDEGEKCQMKMDVYKPIEEVTNNHGVSVFPLTAPGNPPNIFHLLQVLIEFDHVGTMHHGCTAIHWEPEGNRCALVFVKLERGCLTLAWKKPYWSSLKTNSTNANVPDYYLGIRPHEITGNWKSAGPGVLDTATLLGLEEGVLDLSYVKDVTVFSQGKGEKETELTVVLKRYGLDWAAASCLAVLYGTSISDNRTFHMIFPPKLHQVWLEGLCVVIRGLKYQMQLTDRRIIWLKEQYIQLYLERGNSKPSVMDAIRTFGGRDWSNSALATGSSPPDNPPQKQRGTSIRFGGKKKSVGNLHSIKGNEPGPCSSTESTPAIAGKMRQLTSACSSSSLPPPGKCISPSNAPSNTQSTVDLEGNPSPGTRREKWKKEMAVMEEIIVPRAGAITQQTRLNFSQFVALFRSFNLRFRKDIRDLFEQFSVSCRSISETSLSESGKTTPVVDHEYFAAQHIGYLTRNSSFDLQEGRNAKSAERKQIFDAIAAASIISNSAGVDTSKSHVIPSAQFAKFLESKQMEKMTEAQVTAIIRRHEPDASLRCQNFLSFEGFARYLMDKENYAYANERNQPREEDMDRPLSQYYIASSHNTYLTGHQLKGESSVDLYTQVLLSGCRCVELDCWDGDDGNPLIYHGHTFTTKIPFRAVVEAINKAAFVVSDYPVILSLENHCSVPQQNKIAHIFQTVFEDKLVSNFFDWDADEPQLPSPAQLKRRILIKNKKLVPESNTATTVTHNLHPVMKNIRAVQRQQPQQQHQAPRAQSIVSNNSGGSLNDDFSEDDDDDEDDDEDNIEAVTLRTDSLSSHDTPTRSATKATFLTTCTEVDGNYAAVAGSSMEDGVDATLPIPIKSKKQSAQISKELSDIVNYVQAIKFRGLTIISSDNSVRFKRPPATSSVSSKGKPSGASPVLSDSHQSSSSLISSTVSTVLGKQRNVHHPCYQCASLNENAARKICRKQAIALVAHTETQLVRVYPAGMRIDSSNFNPIMYWAFGIQMVALNYQTEDQALHVNATMFEQNGRCGYVLKPSVLWDKTHVMYRRFNPWEKEFDGLHSTKLGVQVISGQYVAPGNFVCSVFVEVELVGIPADSSKQKTRVVQRNSLNPIWNEDINFQVMFADLTFIRFNVCEAATCHVLCQRVVPLNKLKLGYRHLRLRSPQNQPLFASTLFIYTRMEEESVEYASRTKAAMDAVADAPALSPPRHMPGTKRRMFFLMVYGVVPEEASTILKITQESTTQEVIAQALQKAGIPTDMTNDYVLVEEVQRGWDKKPKDKLPATQRILDNRECPLQAQSQWQGEGKFLLKRLGDDPSSRAWLSSIRSTKSAKPQGFQGQGQHQDGNAWEDKDMDNFLVCVYNVSADIPYAILKVPLSACAQDVLAQALIKARRLENPSQFVLVEELEYGGNKQQRILADVENVFSTQCHWPTLGRFILKERTAAMQQQHQKKVKGTLEKFSRFGSCKMPVGEALSDPPGGKSRYRFPFASTVKGGGSARETRAMAGPSGEAGGGIGGVRRREVHSEGETVSDEDPEPRSLSRFKRLSLRKLKVWK